MPTIVIGPCQFCGAEVKADEKRDASAIPLLKRAAQMNRLTCKPCGSSGARTVDRDNPPDILS